MTSARTVEAQQMIRHDLRGRDIDSPQVLAAMERIPRHQFVRPKDEELAYRDRALPIDCEQTISQPYMVALMTQALQLQGDETVLEIGTGSGYQTAVLAELAANVITIERHSALSRSAERRLSLLGYRNITFLQQDGSQGHSLQAPYSRILITAAAEQCPEPLWDQLAEQGLLVGPFGKQAGQVLQRLRKDKGHRRCENLLGCRFVPLIEGLPVS
jgi:protein-L-isoaspartate(D-aspartate) O-methyltransferase